MKYLFSNISLYVIHYSYFIIAIDETMALLDLDHLYENCYGKQRDELHLEDKNIKYLYSYSSIVLHEAYNLIRRTIIIENNFS